MEPKFTPGPWYTSPFAQSEKQHQIGLQERSFDGEVSGCRGTDEYMLVSGLCKKEDAQLMAAAPDMYEALQNIAEYWNQDQNPGAMVDACWHAIETAQAALAKARGE